MKKNFLKGLPEQSHKYSHGTVAVWAGSEEYPGAAVLCVGGARRGGSGYINFIYDSESVKNLVLYNYPDVVVKEFSKKIKVDAWVVGPGAPQLPRKLRLTGAKYVVLDAKAMKHAKNIGSEFVVITPHQGEARDLGFDPPDSDQGRQTTALEMAENFNAVVVLKGSHTVVAAPGNILFVDQVAGPELATAGTGDVLAGLIGSMLASWAPQTIEDVATVVFMAVTAHALAGKAAKKEITPITSSDLLQYLPTVMVR